MKVSNAIWNAIWNPINGPINGPIYSERKQDELRATHELELYKYQDEVYLGKKGAKEKAGSIVQTNECFKSIDFFGREYSFYIFYTSRDVTIKGEEFAGFLSSRGDHFYKEGVEHSKPGRPACYDTLRLALCIGMRVNLMEASSRKNR